MSGKLYVCATPIGNLGDITFRALETLKSVDLIAAEDTRHTLKLLNHFGIKTPMTSYYEHNKREKGKYILARLLGGENVAIVSDAGMPAISDPGEDIVKQCIENDIEMEVLPGASAVTSALVLSGLPTGRFAFEGFLTMNKKRRREHLNEIKNDPRTLIFYEAPHKLKSTLDDMYGAWGERDIVIAREITKSYEEFKRCKLSEAIEFYELNKPKGEIVLLIGGAVPCADTVVDDADIDAMLQNCLDKGMTGKDAVEFVSKQTGARKKRVYAKYLEGK